MSDDRSTPDPYEPLPGETPHEHQARVRYGLKSCRWCNWPIPVRKLDQHGLCADCRPTDTDQTS